MLRGTQGVKRCVRLPRWDTVLCKRSHWSRIQPLSHRWFLIKDIKALVCPFAVLRSRFGLRYSRVRGRRQSKFLASSSTGGARNFYPTGSRAVFQFPLDARPPEVLRTSRGYYFDSAAKGAHFARRLSRDFLGVGTPAVTTVLNIAVKPAKGGLPSSVTVRCQGTAPRHLPQGEG